MGAQIGNRAFYDQVVRVGKRWVEHSSYSLIITTLPNEAGLPNE
jgi:hypothetical protein